MGLCRSSKELQLRTCNHGKPHVIQLSMGEGTLTEKGKLEAAIINKSPLKEMGSSNHSGFLLAELCQSLVGRPVARQGEIFPAGDGKLGWLPARDIRYDSSCWDVE